MVINVHDPALNLYDVRLSLPVFSRYVSVSFSVSCSSSSMTMGGGGWRLGSGRCHDLQTTRVPALKTQRRHDAASTIVRTASFFAWPRQLDHLKKDISSIERPGCAMAAAPTSLDLQVDIDCPLTGTVRSVARPQEMRLGLRIGGAREGRGDSHGSQGGQESHVNRILHP